MNTLPLPLDLSSFQFQLIEIQPLTNQLNAILSASIRWFVWITNWSGTISVSEDYMPYRNLFLTTCFSVLPFRTLMCYGMEYRPLQAMPCTCIYLLLVQFSSYATLFIFVTCCVWGILFLGLRSRTQFLNFGTPLITFKRIELSALEPT